MSDDSRPLSDEERAELEQLRAEKARRQQEERDRRERAELEQLRAQKRQAQKEGHATSSYDNEPPMKSAEQLEEERERREQQRVEAIRDARDAELRERGREFMEPGDDLRMPKGQKLVILGVVVVVVIFVLMSVFGGH
ncbi:MAG: hypothetical protein ACI4B6_00655 [Atopobiaceae bacterium]